MSLNKESIRTSILTILNDRAPNPVSKDLLLSKLKIDNLSLIEITLNEMIQSGNLACFKDSYKLEDYSNIPIRKTIVIGSTEVPRMIIGEVANPEDVNIAIEALAEYADSLERKFKELVEKEMRSYWANLITIFGLFLGLFALITIGSEKIQINPSWSACDLFWMNAAQILPLAVVLIGFVVVLKLFFR